jgi:putative photosynthetic complex assembly protein
MSVSGHATPPVPRGAPPNIFPPVFLVAAVGVAVGSLLAVAWLREPVPPSGGAASIQASGKVLLQVRFVDLPDGSVQVQEARSGAVIDTLVGEAGFVRSTVRGLANARKHQGLGAQIPFELVRRPDGGINFEDPATGRKISLEAFGSTNAAAFTRWLAMPAAPATSRP